MMIYTYTEANKDLSKLLDIAKSGHEVFIRRENGEMFAVKFSFKQGKTYNLPDTDLGLSRDEIISCIREVRERSDK